MLYPGSCYCLKSSFSSKARQKKRFYPFIAIIKKKKKYDLFIHGSKGMQQPPGLEPKDQERALATWMDKHGYL